MTKPTELTDATFDSETQHGLTIVDFWAPWCGPCRVVAPVIEELARDYEGRVKVTKLNVDHNPQVASRYRVMSIPTIMLFKDGQPIDTLIGVQPKRNFEERITRHLPASVSSN